MREAFMQQDGNLWEELYAEAVLETDPSRLADRIYAAQDAIRQRWQALNRAPHSDKERRRVEDAMRTLNLIQQMESRASA
jgi:hypothetical protein